MLTVADLHLWRGDHHVLRGISFEAGPGSCVLLTGRNGTGKTTLLRAIAGLLEPETGEVHWRGAGTKADRDAFHSELAYLGHEPPLKGDLSATENLHYAIGIRRRVSSQEIDGALRRVGAERFADVATRSLSAGQRRRVALAGVLLMGATLWLLDEPTTNLDADGQQLVISILDEQLARGGIVVAAIHQAMQLATPRVHRVDLGLS